MDYELHPYRYITGMKRALARFEQIHADQTTSERDRAMELGMADDLRMFCNRATNHMDGLIKQWIKTGRLTFKIEDMVLAAHGHVFGAFDPLSLPAETVFLKFSTRDPRLEHNPN